MKRFFKVFLLMLLVAAFVISIVACSPSSGYTGTYYEYDRNGNKTSDWIKLEKSKWSSSDGENGRLEVKDGAVTAYSEIFGEEEVFFTGTVSDGVLTYSLFEGIEYKAYKDGAYNSNPGKPSNPDTPSSDTFTVTFDSNGGSEVKSVSVHSDGTISAPENPTKAGYNFAGWYSDRNYSNKWSFSTKIRSDITLYAKWIKVNIEKNISEAGSVSELNGTYKLGDSATVTATTNPGYTFIGWFDGDAELTKELSYTFTMPAENKTYTAKWIVCPITLEKNIEEAGSVSGVERTVLGKETTITATTNPGYTFIGWFDGDTELTKDLSYMFTMSAKDKTFTAKWTFYTISTEKNIEEAGDVTAEGLLNGVLRFDLNGATGTAPSAQTGTSTYPDIPTRNGFVFAGWYETPECTGEPFDFTSDITRPILLYAKWISYSGKGVWQVGNSYSVSVSSKSSSNDYYAFVPLVSGNITFYSSSSWDTYGFLFDANKIQIAEQDEGGVHNNFSITYNVTAGTLYYARPTGYSKSGTLTAHLSGTSKPQDGGKIIYTGNKITAGSDVTLIATTNPGYTFIGWFDGDTELTKDLSYSFTMLAGNKTFTAKWIKVNTEVNLSAAGSVSELTGTYKFGDSVTITATTNPGYTFIGWFDGDTELTKNLSYTFTMPAENKTYTAKWTSYTITTKTNMPGAGTYTRKNGARFSAGTAIAISATTNNGYTFIGWFDGDTELTKELSYTFTMPAENKTFTAKWIKVNIEKNISKAGSVSELNETYKLGDSTTVTATTNPGYTFIGWFDGDAELTKELSYTFTMPAESKTYTAKWIVCPITLEKNIEEAGSVSGVEKTVLGKETTITATTNPGYTFIGWFDGDTELTKELSYTFTMPAENKTFTAKWTYYTVSTETNMPEAGTYIEKNEEKTTVGTEVTLTATTNSGYTWLGWFDCDTELTKDLSYTFTMPAENKTFTAKWIKVNIEKNISEAGSVSELNGTYKLGDSATVTATTNNGYTFIGWFDVDTELTKELTYTFPMPAENKTFTAKWTYYTVSTETNMSEAGTYIEKTEEKTSAGSVVTLTATTNPGYTFIGWFDGDTELTKELTYTFTMPAENKTYTAKWIVCPITLEKDIEEAGSVSGVERTVLGEETIITATTNKGYTFIGWFDGDTELTKDLSYTFTMPAENKTFTAKWIKVSLAKNITAAGSVSELTETYKPGDTVTVFATTNQGYTFIGWFDGDTELTKELTYTFSMPAEDKTFTAKWTYYTLSTGTNLYQAGTYTTKYAEKTTAGTTVTIKASANLQYIFIGWYDGDVQLTTNQTYTFTMPRMNITYKAKFEKCMSHVTGLDCICTKCGVFDENSISKVLKQKAYFRRGKTIYFGTYPQSIVTDKTLTAALSSSAGTFPTSENSQSWTSYGYYMGLSVSDFMWYVDLTHNGEKYRGVYFTSYRRSECLRSSGKPAIIQKENDYYVNTVYWFKYEPIKWRILYESGGKALLFADLALDSQNFDYKGGNKYNSYYATSTIRTWLNDTFYNTAFSYLQKQIIQLTTVKNNHWNSYTTPEDTSDNVFLLSIDEVKNSAYGFNTDTSATDSARQKKSSDYAKSQGCWQRTENGYYGNTAWLLRTSGSVFDSYGITSEGAYEYQYVLETDYGIVPALWIRL